MLAGIAERIIDPQIAQISQIQEGRYVYRAVIHSFNLRHLRNLRITSSSHSLSERLSQV
jgi:hypothetical protein